MAYQSSYRKLERGAVRGARFFLMVCVACLIVAMLFALAHRWGYSIAWTIISPVWVVSARFQYDASHSWAAAASSDEQMVRDYPWTGSTR